MTNPESINRTFFHGVAANICSSLHLEASLANTLKFISDYMPADEIYMGLFDFSVNEYRQVARASLQGGVLLNQNVHLAGDALTMVHQFNKSRPILVSSQTDDPVLSRIIPVSHDSNRSCLIIPLTIDKMLVGTCQIYAWGSNVLTEEHARLLLPVSEIMSVAFSHCLEHLALTRLKQQLEAENKQLKKQLNPDIGAEIIGKNTCLKEVFNMVRLVAPLNSPVLIFGETGTGKELIANAICQASARKDGPFVKVNCGAIPESLIDSELFGHEKGAFTGAVSQKAGRFERAHNGTIFLDEVGELTADAQVRLLRVIQEREIERVGGNGPIPVNIRIICATHRDLHAMVEEGMFREDLFFRINVFPITLPPLRERMADIPALCSHFIEKKAAEFGISPLPAIRSEDMDRLMEYDWPGNVRELQNVIERAMILRNDGWLNFDFSIPYPKKNPVVNQELNSTIQPLDITTARHIKEALEQCHGRISGPSGAAALLNMNASTLRNRMIKLNIKNEYAAKFKKS